MSNTNLEGVPPWVWRVLSRGAILVALLWVVAKACPSLLKIAEEDAKRNAPVVAQTLPICADAEDFRFTRKSGITTKRFVVRPECWSGWINTLDHSTWKFQSVENRGLEFRFMSESQPTFVGPNTTNNFGYGRGIFRMRAPVPGEVVVWVK